MRDSTVIYKSFYESLKEIPKKNQADVWAAICEFAFFGKELELSGISKTVWILIKPQIVSNNKKYENGTKGAEYGKLGGRGNKRKPQTNPKQTPNITPNDNVNDNDNDNDNDNVNDNDNKNEIAPKVFLSLNEEKKIKEKFGDSNKWAIEKLSNYKLSSGKKYKSDYYAIIGWVFDEFIKLKNQTSKNGIQKTERTNPFFDELRAKYSNQESAEQG
jgi:hypothetical protein